MMHNIEKSGFHKGQYVGYGGGAVWRIIKSNGLWRAIEQGEGAKFKSNFMVCNTLREASERLDKLDAHKKNPLPRARAERPGYVGKKSQITGRAPSPRLKKRRAKNTEQGYFPNPVISGVYSGLKDDGFIARYSVQWALDKGAWRVAGKFSLIGDAKLFANTFANAYPLYFVRVTEP